MEEKYQDLTKKFKKKTFHDVLFHIAEKESHRDPLEAYELLKAIPAEEAGEELPLYTAEVDERAFSIEKKEENFIVHGVPLNAPLP